MPVWFKCSHTGKYLWFIWICGFLFFVCTVFQSTYAYSSVYCTFVDTSVCEFGGCILCRAWNIPLQAVTFSRRPLSHRVVGSVSPPLDEMKNQGPVWKSPWYNLHGWLGEANIYPVCKLPWYNLNGWLGVQNQRSIYLPVCQSTLNNPIQWKNILTKFYRIPLLEITLKLDKRRSVA